jgi:hypothetical protein
MPVHFEDLWEQCEKLHQESNSTDVSIIIDELLMKLKLYKMLDDKIKTEDQLLAKSRLLGEILLTITKISLKDNINVFDALVTAYNFHN